MEKIHPALSPDPIRTVSNSDAGVAVASTLSSSEMVQKATGLRSTGSIAWGLASASSFARATICGIMVERSVQLGPRRSSFRWKLYSASGLPPDHELKVETQYMQHVDDDAAKAHRRLLSGGVRSLLDRQSVDWACFITPLWFRNPIDVCHLSKAVATFADTAATSSSDDVGGRDRLPPVAVTQLWLEAMILLIDDAELGQAMIDICWDVIDVD